MEKGAVVHATQIVIGTMFLPALLRMAKGGRAAYSLLRYSFRSVLVLEDSPAAIRGYRDRLVL